MLWNFVRNGPCLWLIDIPVASWCCDCAVVVVSVTVCFPFFCPLFWSRLHLVEFCHPLLIPLSSGGSFDTPAAGEALATVLRSDNSGCVWGCGMSLHRHKHKSWSEKNVTQLLTLILLMCILQEKTAFVKRWNEAKFRGGDWGKQTVADESTSCEGEWGVYYAANIQQKNWNAICRTLKQHYFLYKYDCLQRTKLHIC